MRGPVIYTGLWISSALCLLYLSTWRTLHLPLPKEIAWQIIILGTSCALIYNIYLLDIYNYALSPKKVWGKKNRRFIYAGLGALIVVSLYSLTQVSIYWVYLLLPAALPSIFYYLPLNFKNKGKGLRELPFLKPFWVALTWTYVSTVLPALYMNALNKESLSLTLSRFLFLLSLTLVFDVKDRETDATRGLKTLAQKMSFNRLRILALFCLGLSALFILNLQHTILFAWLLSLAATSLALLFMKKKSGEIYYDLCLDGQLLLQGQIFIWLA